MEYKRITREGEQDDLYIVINANRRGYGIEQVESKTMTIGELIEELSRYPKDTKIVVGNDAKSYGWYTYGQIRSCDLYEVEMQEDEDTDEDEED